MCVRITSVLERHARGLAALLILACALAPGVRAQPGSWVGKTILVKKSGIKIGHTDKNGNQVHHATLIGIDHKVVADQGGWLKVRQQGVEGWFDKADAVLLEDAVEYFTGLIRRNEKDANAYGHRAIAWRLKGELDIALKDYDEAIRLSPQSAALWNNRGSGSRNPLLGSRPLRTGRASCPRIRLKPSPTPLARRGRSPWLAHAHGVGGDSARTQLQVVARVRAAVAAPTPMMQVPPRRFLFEERLLTHHTTAALILP